MIDTVFSLDDFLKIFHSEGGNKNDIRICVEQESTGSSFVKCKVVVSAGIYSLTSGQPKKVLKCIVAQRAFNYPFLASPHENEEKKQYNEWVKNAYKKVEEKLGFKPIEGFWKWQSKP